MFLHLSIIQSTVGCGTGGCPRMSVQGETLPPSKMATAAVGTHHYWNAFLFHIGNTNLQ